MEIIKRKIKADREELKDKIQFSFNSDGRIAIKIFEKTNPNEDRLIVLTTNETWELIHFIRDILKA